MRHNNIIRGASKRAPVVEMDSAAHAAYVRFSRNPVKETKVVTEDRCVVTIDLDASGEVIGVEFVGVKDFNIKPLLKMAGIKASEVLTDRTRYVAAEMIRTSSDSA